MERDKSLRLFKIWLYTFDKGKLCRAYHYIVNLSKLANFFLAKFVLKPAYTRYTSKKSGKTAWKCWHYAFNFTPFFYEAILDFISRSVVVISSHYRNTMHVTSL